MSNARYSGRAQMLAACATACLATLAPVAAQAAVPAYGWACNFGGSTLAEGGSPAALVSNAHTLSAASCGGNAIESHGTVYGAQWTGDDYFNYSFAQGARTAANASAGLGVLHAFSTSATTSTPKSYIYTTNSGETAAIDNEYLAYGTSAASASWYDQITVNQGAQYGRVVLKFTLALSGNAGVTPSTAGSAGILARFIADDDRNVSDRTLSLSDDGTVSFTAGYWPGTVIKLYGDLSATTQVRAGGKYQLPNGWWATGNYIPTAEATANAANTAGFQVEVLTEGGSYTSASGHSYVTVIKLYGDLSATTQVRAGGKYQLPNGWWATGNYIPTAEATANAANTAGFQVEVLTEGGSYTSASGHSYVTAVPEPSSAALMGLGAACLLVRGRRRR